MDPADRHFRLFVAGVPRPHQRPELRAGRYRQRHDRPQDLAWRTTVRAAWLAGVGSLAWAGPVSLDLTFFGGRGDLTNKIKAVEDALGATGWRDGLAPLYRDDRQVVQLHAEQQPAGQRGPGVEIIAALLC